jgi:thiamine phosphate synthase YjbQ (UPF0047 family)
MKTISVRTQKKDQVIDITDTVERYLRQEGPEDGLCSIFVAHTTCALTTADLDPGTDLDLLDALRHMLPHLSYRHPHDPHHTLRSSADARYLAKRDPGGARWSPRTNPPSACFLKIATLGAM